MQVQPQPTPVAWGLGVAQMSDGSSRVFMQLQTVVGTIVVFLPWEAAVQLGNELVSTGKSAATGLVLPPGVVLGNPNGAGPTGT